jgi:large subunit ribosomal protein L16
MLKQPKRIKFKRLKKTYLKNCLETRSFHLNHGFIGLKASSSLRITARQMEALRQCLSRELKRRGKIWFNIFPHTPVSSKPTENRMGKGKGSLDYWCTPIKVGTVLVEIGGISFFKAKEALLKGRNKLPIKSSLISKYK